MYLLNTHQVELRFFSSCDATPPFAILSHVWGQHEQTFQEVQAIMKSPSSNQEMLSQKIRECCRFARRLGFDWVWVDTCCINKESSAELDEAINSMFVWYGRATRCLAYLEDIEDDDDPNRVEGSLENSRWFKRGWTLQELIAPRHVLFLSRSWTPLGTKKGLAHILHRITGIDVRVLTFNCNLKDISVGQRLSWAADRETTRIEDKAYCLMGIFEVHMRTMYGEGTAAFRRLQEEILEQTADQTLFAWENDASFDAAEYGLLAPSPSLFRSSGELRHLPADKLQDAIRAFMKALGGDGFAGSGVHTFSATNIGTHARLPIIECEGTEAIALGVLAVQRGDFYVSLVLNRTGDLGSLPLYSCGGYRQWGGGVRTLELRDDPVHGGMWALWDEPGNGKPYLSWKEMYVSGARFSALDNRGRGAHRPILQESLTVSIPAWVLSDLAMSGFISTDIPPDALHQPVRIFPPSPRGSHVNDLVTRTSMTLTFRCARGYPELDGAEEVFQLWLEMERDGKGLQARVVLPSRSQQQIHTPRWSLEDHVAGWPAGARTFTQRDAGAERSVRLRFLETQGTPHLLLEIELMGDVYSRLRSGSSKHGYLALAKANGQKKRQQA